MKNFEVEVKIFTSGGAQLIPSPAQMELINRAVEKIVFMDTVVKRTATGKKAYTKIMGNRPYTEAELKLIKKTFEKNEGKKSQSETSRELSKQLARTPAAIFNCFYRFKK